VQVYLGSSLSGKPKVNIHKNNSHYIWDSLESQNTMEMESGRITAKGQPRQKVSHILSQPVIPACARSIGGSIMVPGWCRQKARPQFKNNLKSKRLGGMVQVAQWLPSNRKALSSNSSISRDFKWYFFGGVGGRLGFVLAKQAPYCLSHISSLFCPGYFEDRVL
jgi:hypothetical protein